MKQSEKMKMIEFIPILTRRLILSLLVLSIVLLIPTHSFAKNGGQSATNQGIGTYALIPGNIKDVCIYTDLLYSFPARDFLYYFNDRLLFLEKPEGLIVKNGYRKKLLDVVNGYSTLKKALHSKKKKRSNFFSLSVANSRGFKRTSRVLKAMGLSLEKRSGNYYHINNSEKNGNNGFRKYAGFDTKLRHWNNQLNTVEHFRLPLKESRLYVPWNYRFLQSITGIPLNEQNFFETMLGNEDFSLLLGILYRLTPDAISYIDNITDGTRKGSKKRSKKASKLRAWQEIYKNKKFLMGMFILSHALRMDSGAGTQPGWKLPGGKAGEMFWFQLVGENPRSAPRAFLRKLATEEEGKFNYLFLFSSFLQPQVQQLLFSGQNGIKLRELLLQIRLNKKEKLNKNYFPRFSSANFFTMLYTLQVKDEQFYLPLGIDNWGKAIQLAKFHNIGKTVNGDDPVIINDVFALMAKILMDFNSQQEEKPLLNDHPFVHTFLALHGKFAHRSGLMTPELLTNMAKHYREYNVLLDFIEKLPIQKSTTAVSMLEWVKGLQELNSKDRKLFTVIYQALFELLSHAAKYAPKAYDYDVLVQALTAIPLESNKLYDNLFQFFENHLGIQQGIREMSDVVLKGVTNREFRFAGNNYWFNVRNMSKEYIAETLTGQDAAFFTSFLDINRYLVQLSPLVGAKRGSSDYITAGSLVKQIIDILQQFPYAQIDENAPKDIRDRIMPYDRDDFNDAVDLFRFVVTYRNQNKRFHEITADIKQKYMLPQLKDYLVTLVYAVNARNGNLRAFLNPNLVRLHDFDATKDHTPWNFCGRPQRRDEFSGFMFAGGLSRLNISLTYKWLQHLFNRTYVHNGAHLQAVMVNLFDTFPMPVMTDEEMARAAGMVDKGMDIIARGCKDPEFRSTVISALGEFCTGFHLQQTIAYLQGKVNTHPLFFSELKQLGESLQTGKLMNNTDRSIQYYSSGSLQPRPNRLFPQEIANFFDSGWHSGEIVSEFKVKLQWQLHRSNIPAVFLGQFLYAYFNEVAPVIFSQNHPNDYYSTYVLFDMFNDSYLRNMIKNFQKEGHLKLR
jgi:hypothetical protein